MPISTLGLRAGIFTRRITRLAVPVTLGGVRRHGRRRGCSRACGCPRQINRTKLLAKEVVVVSEPAAGYNIHDAKTQLSRIIERVERGEEIIIKRAGTPVAKVVPLPRTVRRRGRGSLRGQVTLSPDWDSSAVNDDITVDFEPDA